MIDAVINVANMFTNSLRIFVLTPMDVAVSSLFIDNMLNLLLQIIKIMIDGMQTIKTILQCNQVALLMEPKLQLTTLANLASSATNCTVVAKAWNK